MKEKVFVDLWNAESNFHSGLIQKDASVLADVTDSESQDSIDLKSLTEAEKEFHTNLLAENRREKVKVIASNHKAQVNKFTRNAFLPIAPSRWIEMQSREVNDKLWDLLTFNYLAPIQADFYCFLTSLSEDEMKKCSEKTLMENTELIRGDHALTPDNIKLPILGEFDPTKCLVSPCMLAARGFMGPRVQSTIAELKRIWNVGRPFLKCQCIVSGKGDCGKNITWFDHAFWYLLSDLQYLFPNAPTLRSRARAFRTLVKTAWRAPVLASVVFTHMRDIMVSMAYSVVADPSRTPQNILSDPAVMVHKFPRTMAKWILPSRYVQVACKKRKEAEEVSSSSKKARRSQQTTLEFYVAKPVQQQLFPPGHTQAADKEGTSPLGSTVTT
ncbi:hypothetical protein CBR_g56130 [Chara braunii]|uniref:Uncharacterized protein n=1 Tax=Chara braunii TaxID=69332 RepID=A0A388MDF5_CHABU|nr:hypothetical protein CBR_g56130 [Chara braunii]|eukprot:GBG92594.1 hypothetical protein CBR_g56130 [Chara braunii]